MYVFIYYLYRFVYLVTYLCWRCVVNVLAVLYRRFGCETRGPNVRSRLGERERERVVARKQLELIVNAAASAASELLVIETTNK